MTQSWKYQAVGNGLPGGVTVFLPGWAFSGAVLSLAGKDFPWLAPVAPLDAATAVSDLAFFLQEAEIGLVRLVGWSLGAHLALDFANRFPERVASLALLALRSSWPAAEIAAIRAGLQRDPHAFLRDFYRKCFLGYRSEYRHFLADQQEELLETIAPALLARGLDYLASWRLPVKPLSGQVFCWHGRRDVIAPLAERAVIPGAESRVLDHAGHALFFDQEFPGRD
ncbi:alpha/beta fold hydrolase [Thiovibrio sp. JS02]